MITIETIKNIFVNYINVGSLLFYYFKTFNVYHMEK